MIVWSVLLWIYLFFVSLRLRLKKEVERFIVHLLAYYTSIDVISQANSYRRGALALCPFLFLGLLGSLLFWILYLRAMPISSRHIAAMLSYTTL
jgi:hypothetical protein